METGENRERREDELRARAEEAMQEVKQEEIPPMAEERASTGPNAFWNQKGSWWILIVVFALVLFLFLWMFLA